MRLPIVYIPKTKIKKFIHIEKRYKCKYILIPLGCDCHPAYVLNSLYLRKVSFPFDWLNIKPIETFKYVNDNINDEFENFLKNIKLNERGYFISEKYPCSEFMHEKELNQIDSINKFERRTQRFLNLFQNEKIAFLHNIPVNSIKDEKELSYYINSIKLFKTKISQTSLLNIYLRFDENLNENKLLADELFNELNELNINTFKYVRNIKKNGIWGQKSKYYYLLTSMGIKLKLTFPKIFIK
jgi:hypothetical protein